MKKYLVDAKHLWLDGPDAPQTSDDGVPKVRMYIATPVEARIAALQGALGMSPCPYPIGDDISVQKCIRAGKCGCENRSLMERAT
jgi:hypothetical protein